MEHHAWNVALLIGILILFLDGGRFSKLCIVLFALVNFAKNIFYKDAINQIKSDVNLYLRPTTITIKLKPHTKCYGINNPQPLCNKTLNNNIDTNNILLPHETNVLIRDGFTFKFVNSDDAFTNNIRVNNCDVYTLGPIKTCNDMDNIESFTINPKAITVKSGTPYYSWTNRHCTSHCDKYYYISKGEIIMLPGGTLYNDGNYNEVLTCNTKVIVA